MKEDKPLPDARKLQARNCFVCGHANFRGLRIPFYLVDDIVTASFIPDDNLCGFEKVVHGGILFALCDEAMMHLIWATGIRAVSAEVVIRFHDFARTGDELLVKAEFVEKSEHLIKASCLLSAADGRKIATTSGKFLPLSEKEKRQFEKVF